LTRSHGIEAFAAALPLCLLAFWGWDALQSPQGTAPAERLGSRYVGSVQCGACHPDHLRSWKATYHRTMTQTAGPASVMPRIDGELELDLGGERVAFRRDGDRYFVRLPWLDGSVRELPVLYTIGSRRMQQYAVQDGDRIHRIPVFYDIEAGRFRHINEAFFRLRAEGREAFVKGYALWNANCIFCHNTRPEPGYDPAAQRFGSRVAELGIACEECHGPGALHVRLNQNPVRRYAARALALEDPAITNPSRLSALRAAQLCGQCHGQRLPRPLERIDELMRRGDPFVPGDDLFAFYRPLQREDTIPGYRHFHLRFWSDGSPRLTAYELQGLLASKCFQKSGTLSCTSCHRGHSDDPKGMIEPEMRTDAACTGCHSRYRGPAAASRHSAHRPGSATCYDCHMPQVVYGVLTAHPTHLIRNPEPERTVRYNLPNACNLCHLERSVNWSLEQEERLWGGSRPRGGEAFDRPEVLRALAQGDVVYRTLVLHHVEKRRLRGVDGLLLAGLQDPYHSARRFAARALEAGRAQSPASEEAWEQRLLAEGVRVPAEFGALRGAGPAEEPFEFGE
jgi:predicted CXXCH cytochrome family protein